MTFMTSMTSSELVQLLSRCCFMLFPDFVLCNATPFLRRTSLCLAMPSALVQELYLALHAESHRCESGMAACPNEWFFLQKSCEATARLSHRLTVALSPVSFTLLSESNNTKVLEHPFYERLHTLAKPCLIRIAIYFSLQTDHD